MHQRLLQIATVRSAQAVRLSTRIYIRRARSPTMRFVSTALCARTEVSLWRRVQAQARSRHAACALSVTFLCNIKHLLAIHSKMQSAWPAHSAIQEPLLLSISRKRATARAKTVPRDHSALPATRLGASRFQPARLALCR